LINLYLRDCAAQHKKLNLKIGAARDFKAHCVR
jgi:hypothetical protein